MSYKSTPLGPNISLLSTQKRSTQCILYLYEQTAFKFINNINVSLTLELAFILNEHLVRCP
jgi:hypothetical protein